MAVMLMLALIPVQLINFTRSFKKSQRLHLAIARNAWPRRGFQSTSLFLSVAAAGITSYSFLLPAAGAYRVLLRQGLTVAGRSPGARFIFCQHLKSTCFIWSARAQLCQCVQSVSDRERIWRDATVAPRPQTRE